MNRQLTKIAIPEGVAFADLDLARKPDGSVSFNWDPIEKICAASGVDVALFRDQDEDNVASLIAAWYAAAQAAGEPVDPIQEDLIKEILLEDERGGGLSHPPGRA